MGRELTARAKWDEISWKESATASGRAANEIGARRQRHKSTGCFLRPFRRLRTTALHDPLADRERQGRGGGQALPGARTA